MADERELFLKETERAGVQVLEALVEEASSQSIIQGALFDAERLAEAANARGESKNMVPLTPAEVRFALAPYVKEGVVGVRCIYGGKRPRNGDHQGPAYAFYLLNKDKAREMLPKREY